MIFILRRCPGEDLNLHAFRHQLLKLTCMPFHHPGTIFLNPLAQVPSIGYFHKFDNIINAWYYARSSIVIIVRNKF